jgi:hypothetical protein
VKQGIFFNRGDAGYKMQDASVAIKRKIYTFAQAFRPDGGIGRRVGLKNQ